jgi:dipeptidyl aminopeptidase/acylaminoacyl peptidase
MKYLVDIKYTTYKSGTITVPCVIAQPKKSEKYPCIIYNRGGTREFGKITPEHGEYWLEIISSWGYVVIASQYRGLKDQEGADEYGGADIADVVNIAEVLNTIPNADTTRIGMFGFSRGGMMTYLALQKMKNIKAAVIGGGLADLVDANKRRPKLSEVFHELIAITSKTFEQGLKDRSAVYWPEKFPPTPLLLMHGTADQLVFFKQSTELADKLSKFKHTVKLVLYENDNHGLDQHRREMFMETRDWFEKYV